MTFYPQIARDLVFVSAVFAAQGFAIAQAPQRPVQQAPQSGAAQQQQQPSAGQRIPIVTADKAIQQGTARAIQAPWAPLAPAFQQYVDQVLDVWEKKTDGIQTYQCDLMRWQYNPAFYAGGHYTKGTGTLRFQDPGKAEFKMEEVEQLTNKNPPAYAVDPNEKHGEHWICDGQWVHILDQNKKQATRIQLPPSYRGEKVYQSPLPFVFGVKAAEMKNRYWIRPLQANRPGEVWLEAVPKRADDAANYSKVQIVLDQKDTLPKGLIVFMPNWTEKQPHREVFQFNNRQTNMVMANLRMNLFNKNFIPTKLGSDWKVDEQPWVPQQVTAGQNRVAAPQMQTPTRR